MSGLPRRRFLIYDTLGALLWAGSLIGLGYIFADQLELVAHHAFHLGGWLLLLLLAALAVFIGLKWRQRRRFLKSLVADRIHPEELKTKLDAGESIVVLDLRLAVDSLHDPRTIPGALRVTPEELQHRYSEIPAHSEIVLYCSCPNEVTSARTAFELKKLGVTSVRPLTGGFHGWKEKGFPLALPIECTAAAGMTA